MPTSHMLNVDLANVYKRSVSRPTADDYVTTLAWGDEVELIDTTAKHVEIEFIRHRRQPDGSVKPIPTRGFIRPAASSRIRPADVLVARDTSRILKLDFVDVQQGDGTVIETPRGEVLLIDGGEIQLFARYLANRFPGTSDAAPKPIGCIVVTHGDADHFAGLTEIHESETHDLPYKRCFMQPRRVYHNGLVKRPNNRPEAAQLGATIEIDGKTIITGLEENLLAVPSAEMNQPFKAWQRALKDYARRGEIGFRRLVKGDDDAFDFLRDEAITVEVLGPIPVTVNGVAGLRFLGTPVEGLPASIDDEARETRFTGLSASHTINGHSIVLRLKYGRFRFLFAGDLNAEAELDLTRAHLAQDLDLTAEVLKAPHHGSADFSWRFLRAVSPVISVVSAGDENARKEYIHPRATLIGALGKQARPGIEEPLIFVTEMVAFFATEGWIDPEDHEVVDGVAVVRDGQAVLLPARKRKRTFFAFSRPAFGIVKIRTDGERLLVFTNSGQIDLKEAYAYQMNDHNQPERVIVRRA